MEDIGELLKRLELELLEPAVRADASCLDALLADDFTEVGASGRTFGKDEVLSRLPTEMGVEFSIRHMRSRLLSPTVGLVTYVAQRTANGSTVQSRRSSIWVESGHTWKMLYHQGTPSD
jgi:hypothetical protein